MRPTHSSPQPSRYLVMSVHSAGSALSWYKSLFMKCGVRARGYVGRKPDHAILANLLFPVKASAYNADLASIPGSGRSHGEGNGNPLQCSCQDMTEQLNTHTVSLLAKDALHHLRSAVWLFLGAPLQHL